MVADINIDFKRRNELNAVNDTELQYGLLTLVASTVGRTTITTDCDSSRTSPPRITRKISAAAAFARNEASRSMCQTCIVPVAGAASNVVWVNILASPITLTLDP
jgi:hypothetical protein